MKFRTEYQPQKASETLDSARPIVLLGSCFTDSIGSRMLDCRWEAYPNLCGPLYNPASIANILRLAMSPDEEMAREVEESIDRNGEIYCSWLMGSQASAFTPGEVAGYVKERLRLLKEKLKEAQALIVTFGTSWIYELREMAGYVVSNCHKFPACRFQRRRLSVDEIAAMWEDAILLLRRHNPNLRLIFTVSPIRHLKDGFEGNSRSKATLLLACEKICDGNGSAEYFPSYEILNDDLRDYRFYADDLVHPSGSGVEYIWEKFCARYISEEGMRLLAEGERAMKALRHRPLIKKA